MARSIDPDGLRALQEVLDRAADQAPDLVETVMAKTMGDTTADAQLLAPVDTGYLRQSITYDVTRTGDQIVGEAGPTASYGEWVDGGTSRHSPQPFMRPAFDRHLPAFEQVIAQVAGDSVG